MEDKIYCPMCKRNVDNKNFYRHKDGITPFYICKECATADIKDNNPSTFLNLMEQFDIPYIKSEWNHLVQRNKDKAVETGFYVSDKIHTVFGKYLSMMKLTGYKHWTFKDSEQLNKWNEEKKVKGGYMFFDNVPIEDLFKMIRIKFEHEKDVNEVLKEENKKLKEGIWEKEEVKYLKERCEQMEKGCRNGFLISEEENKKIDIWVKQHEIEHPGGHGCSGGKYSYIFIPTSIGTFGKIRCTCGKEFSFQDGEDF